MADQLYTRLPSLLCLVCSKRACRARFTGFACSVPQGTCLRFHPKRAPAGAYHL